MIRNFPFLLGLLNVFGLDLSHLEITHGQFATGANQAKTVKKLVNVDNSSFLVGAYFLLNDRFENLQDHRLEAFCAK